MTELEVKIIKFLLSSAVYSENAIMKNFGIDRETLDKSFKILEDNGYLESYEEYMKRESLNEEGDCCKTKKIVLVQAVLLALVIHALQVQVAVIIIFLVI